MTFIPNFNNFSLADRFIGRSDFCMSREMMKFFYIHPIVPPDDGNFDIDFDPQGYINKTMRKKNKLSI